MVITNKKKFIRLDNVAAYKISSELSDYVWRVVSDWDWLKRAGVRGLIENKEKDFVLSKLRLLPKEINLLIKITQNKLKI